MGIRREQPGAAKAAATTGTLIGTAQKAEESRAAARQKASQERQIKASEDAQARAMQWESDKMAMRSAQDFQEELRKEQFQLDKVQRAREWDVEKMEIASRLDFERKEKQRQIELERIDTRKARLKKAVSSGETSEDSPFYIQTSWEIDQDLRALEGGSGRVGEAPGLKGGGLFSQLKKDSQTPTAKLTPDQITLPMAEEAAANKEVYVRDTESGDVFKVPLSDVKSLVNKKEAEIINPKRVEEEIKQTQQMGFYPVGAAASGVDLLDARAKDFEAIGKFLESFFLTKSTSGKPTQRMGFPY